MWTGGLEPVADKDEASIVADEAAVMAEDLSVLLLDVAPERRHPYRDRLVRARDLLAEVLAELGPLEPQGPPPQEEAQGLGRPGRRPGLARGQAAPAMRRGPVGASGPWRAP
jgi:hypothetical protein